MIAIFWIIGTIIGFVLTAVNIGKYKAENPDKEVAVLGVMACIFASIVWPISIILFVIMWVFFKIIEWSARRTKTRIEKHD